MFRHKSLHPLTWDHHHGLVAAHRLMRSAELPEAEAKAAAEAFVAFAHEHLEPHFRAEEEVLLDALRPLLDPSTDPQCERMIAEHKAFWARLADYEAALAQGAPSPAMSVALGQSLDDHIRFEERELFERIQELLDEDSLERLGEELHRDHTAA